MSEPLRILLVEDNEMNRDMLSRRLLKRGYNVLLAEDGEQALLAASEHLPDVILMDMSLPVLDGWEATRLLGQADRTRGIPIIGLTAHAHDSERQKAYQAGCVAFETKPVDFPRLLEIIEKFAGGGK